MVLATAAAIVVVSSCASSNEITAGTASEIRDVPPDQITIGDVSGSALSRYTWTATTPNGVYNCSTDYMRRWTFCSPVGSDEAEAAKAPAQ